MSDLFAPVEDARDADRIGQAVPHVIARPRRLKDPDQDGNDHQRRDKIAQPSTDGEQATEHRQHNHRGCSLPPTRSSM